MKKKFPLLIVMLALLSQAGAQTMKYATDESCGCDILYVNGIETTKSDTLYGFRLEDGTVIAPNIYRFVDRFHGGYCKVFLDYGQCGLIDSTGRQVVPCIYDNVRYPSDGRIAVEKGGMTGFTDLDGNVVIPLTLLSAGDFNEGCAPIAVVIDSFFVYGTYIDTEGRQLFPPVYQDVSPYVDGFAGVKMYEKWGLIDHSGKMVLPTVYEFIIPLPGGDSLFFAGDENGLALFDSRMKALTPFVYTWIGGYSDGRISVQRGGRFGFLDRDGREVIPCIYDETGLFGLQRAYVRMGDRYGIIDTDGAEVLPLEYENTTPKAEKYIYHDSLALVEQDHRFGFVDLEGHIVIPLLYQDAYQFSEGLASVRYQGYWGYIDRSGDVRIPFLFDLASPVEYNRAEVVYQGVTRKMDGEGNCVRNCNGIIAWKTRKE